MAHTHSNPIGFASQLARHRRGPYLACGLVAFYLTLGGGAGCRNLYREGQAAYPADPMTRFQARLEEAHNAETRALAAFTILQTRLAEGLDPQAVQPDVDRLEMTTMDFRRRVTSVQDAVRACPDTAGVDAELEQLDQRAAQMLNAVEQIRQNGGTLSPDVISDFLGKHSEK